MTDQIRVNGLVCSAHAEVIPGRRPPTGWCHGLLRTRGDDPTVLIVAVLLASTAPHTRR